MTKSELKQLIAEDQIKKVIQWLLEATERMRDSDLHNEVVQQSSKYNDYLKSKMAGTKSQDDLDVQIAKINAALTYIIDKLPETPTTQQPKHPTTPANRKPLYLAAAAILLSLIAMAIKFFPTGSRTPFEITISLQGPELPDYPPLKDAKLGIKLDNKWEEAAVDEHGDADFKGISGNFEGKMVPVRLQSKYWQAQQDSVVLEGKSTSIEVAPNGLLAQIRGLVRSADGNEYLEGVEIRLDNGALSVMTDSKGFFEFSEIPASLQKESYNLTATKAGYEADSRFAYPETGAVEIRLSPKK
ncbi:MAG: hypothetical protein WA004_11435 [Saprospiraceae bacterium]